MIRRIRHTLLLALLFLAAPTVPGAAQPLPPENGNDTFGGTPGMHLFLQSNFLRSQQEERLFLARIRGYRADYRHAIDRDRYAEALAACDSLIRLIEREPQRNVRLSRCYKNRADLLLRLRHYGEACTAYERAIKVTDSLQRLAQDDVVREMQASYELDRLALDEALLQAHHHKTALVALSLLVAAAVLGVGFIHAANRRTKRLQRVMLLEVQRARESEEKKRAFINAICHEVRTPLNCVAGFSELICSEEVTPETHAEYSAIIRENRRQLRYIFDDLLETAHLENLVQPFPRRYMDLCACCRTQLRTMKVRFPKAGLRYTESIPAEEIGLLINEKYLGMLLGKLLDNAYRFTERGTVGIACGRADDEHVFIAVTDTGCGIPPADRERVFERFTKLDTFRPGNGLGLYLCRLIVRHMGGEIRIDDTYTGGTRMVVTLPRK